MRSPSSSPTRLSSASPRRTKRTIPTSPPRMSHIRMSTPGGGDLDRPMADDVTPPDLEISHIVTAAGDENVNDETIVKTPKQPLPRPSTATLERPKRANDRLAATRPRVDPKMDMGLAGSGTIKKGTRLIPPTNRDRSISTDRRPTSRGRPTGIELSLIVYQGSIIGHFFRCELDLPFLAEKITKHFSSGDQKVTSRTEPARKSGQNGDSRAAEEVGHSSPVWTSSSRLPDCAANIQNCASGQEMKQKSQMPNASPFTIPTSLHQVHSRSCFYQIYRV